MILVSTAVGFWFGLARHTLAAGEIAALLNTLAGVGLMASGTAALNQWWERNADARMRRTASRPIPSGRIGARPAFAFGLAVSAAGFMELALAVNWLSASLGLLTLLTYLLIYTPLKQRSSVCTTVGAFPGAMPPVIGFAAAHGSLTLAAWVLGAILFLWQFPHFYAIAWMYREDYGRAGIRMLPVLEPDGKSTVRRMILFGAVLLPVSMLPWVIGMTAPLYAIGACVLGVWYLSSTISGWRGMERPQARRVLLTSVAYLPLLYAIMLLDRR